MNNLIFFVAIASQGYTIQNESGQFIESPTTEIVKVIAGSCKEAQIYAINNLHPSYTVISGCIGSTDSDFNALNKSTELL